MVLQAGRVRGAKAECEDGCQGRHALFEIAVRGLRRGGEGGRDKSARGFLRFVGPGKRRESGLIAVTSTSRH